MALGRPVNKNARNKVIVHTIGDHRYASTKVYTVDADGKKHYAYKHWGTLVDGNRFYPGTNYFYAPVAERNKLIFPSKWDMSEVSELSSTRRRGRVSYQEEDVDRQQVPHGSLTRSLKRPALKTIFRKSWTATMRWSTMCLRWPAFHLSTICHITS